MPPVTLASAFPADLSENVAAVVATMPPDRLAPSSFQSVLVGGEELAVLARVYNDEPPDAAVQALTPTQLAILHCLYSRHHNGCVRQRHIEQVAASTDPWVIPFVIELVGEYIPQILVSIQQALPDLRDATSARHLAYGQFIRANPAYFNRIQRKLTSYWTCYWRDGKQSAFEDYPGCALIESLRDAAALPDGPPWPRQTPRGPRQLNA